MQNRKLFALLWRINAVVILLVGLAAVAVLGVAAYVFFKDATRTRYVDNVANTALDDVRESTAELGSFEQIPGSTMLRAPITVHQSYAMGPGYKEAGSVRNYLYVEPTTRSAHWLRPSMNGLILSSTALPSAGRGERERDAVVYVHVTVEKDTNGDERLTESDAKQIAVSAPDGKGYRVLVDKADRLNEATLLPDGQLLVLYSTGAKLTAVELHPANLALPVATYEVNTSLR